MVFFVSDSTRSSLENFGLEMDSNESKVLRLELGSTREKVDLTHLYRIAMSSNPIFDPSNIWGDINGIYT